MHQKLSLVPFGSFDLIEPAAGAAEKADKAEKVEISVLWSGFCFEYELYVVQDLISGPAGKRRFVENPLIQNDKLEPFGFT